MKRYVFRFFQILRKLLEVVPEISDFIRVFVINSKTSAQVHMLNFYIVFLEFIHNIIHLLWELCEIIQIQNLWSNMKMNTFKKNPLAVLHNLKHIR